jgi:hypothetical protein
VKKYRKLYKAMFHKYATLYNNKISLKAKTFDIMRTLQQKMSLTEIFQFLNDFQMNKKFNVKREDIQRLIKLVNLKNDPRGRNNSELDIDGFMEFILQLGHFAHDQHPLPSVFLPALFNFFKQVSFDSEKPLFQRLFEDPQASSIGDPKLLDFLTQKVNEDPDF